MKQCVQLVPSVTSQEALITCVTCRVAVFAIERPLYSAVLPSLDDPDFLPGYSLELFSNEQIVVAKRLRLPHPFREKNVKLIYPPLGWV